MFLLMEINKVCPANYAILENVFNIKGENYKDSHINESNNFERNDAKTQLFTSGYEKHLSSNAVRQNSHLNFLHEEHGTMLLPRESGFTQHCLPSKTYPLIHFDVELLMFVGIQFTIYCNYSFEAPYPMYLSDTKY